MVLDKLHITRGQNDVLIASDGQEYIDFITGFGAVLLGHGHRPVIDRVRKQLDDVWLTGRLEVPVIEEAANLVTAGLAKTYRHLQFYSSGNEAVEFAIRMASIATRRRLFASSAPPRNVGTEESAFPESVIVRDCRTRVSTRQRGQGRSDRLTPHCFSSRERRSSSGTVAMPMATSEKP